MGEIIPHEVEVTAIGVRNVGELSDDVIKEALGSISEFESRKEWVKGDLLREYEERHPDSISKIGREQMEFDFIGTLAALDVSKKIPLSHRLMSLSFPHHREIAIECDTLAEMDEWLKKANEAGWSLTELRKELRGREVDQSKTGKTTGKLEWLAGLQSAARGVLRKPVEQLKADERNALKEVLAPLVALYEQVTGGESVQSATSGRESDGHPPGKESIESGAL